MPNRNSNAIETTLSEIPGLNEHFIYFNDDFFLTQPAKWTDFFTWGGKPYIPTDTTTAEPMVNNTAQPILRLKLPKIPMTAFKKGWIHAPHARLKSMATKFQNEYSDYIKWVQGTQSRKRNGCDICVQHDLKCPCQQQHHLLDHYMYTKNRAIPKEPGSSTYITRVHIQKNTNIFKNFMQSPTKYLCINDTTNISPSAKLHIDNFFETYYPEKPLFETVGI